MQDSLAAPASAPPGRGEARPFRSGLARVVIAKELTLIRRDPNLIARALLQLLYMVPLLVILIRRTDMAPLLGASLVLLCGNLAGTLAWITVSGEEAPDLVGTAPVSQERVRWLKVGAALLPVAIIAAPFLVIFASGSLVRGALVAVFLAGALTSTAVVQVWTGKPGSGRDLKVRGRQNVLANVIDGLSGFGWAGACFLAVTGQGHFVPLALCLALVGPVVAWFAGRRRRAA
jgi:ABC-2 type transport system permease protein